MTDNTIKAFNRMSAAALKEQQNNAPLEFVENPHKPGKVFFVCGSVTGYCSPAVQRAYQSVNLSDLQFAEVAKDGNPANAVPCLMMVGNSNANVKRSL